MPSEVRGDKFKLFVEFVLARFNQYELITPKDVVSIEDCPVKDQETASKYLGQMMKAGVHLKERYTNGKVYFLGCTPEEDAALKRAGFEGWMGVKMEEFFGRRHLVGRIVLERAYRFLEYGDPPFPILAKMFPLVSGIITERAGRREEGSGPP